MATICQLQHLWKERLPSKKHGDSSFKRIYGPQNCLVHPISNKKRALQRRDYVLRRMSENNFIGQEDYTTAFLSPVTAKLNTASIELKAPYVSEMARQEMEENWSPEVEKCCRGSKIALAALANVGCCFFVEGRVLRSEMGPKMAFEDCVFGLVFRR